MAGIPITRINSEGVGAAVLAAFTGTAAATAASILVYWQDLTVNVKAFAAFGVVLAFVDGRHAARVLWIVVDRGWYAMLRAASSDV